MDDGLAPNPGMGSGSTVDFSCVVGGDATGTYIGSYNMGNGIYRCVFNATASHAVANNGIAKYSSNTNRGFTASGYQLIDITGVSNTNPIEYLDSNTYYNAGVPGVKYFNTYNGNTVNANIVTESVGTALPVYPTIKLEIVNGFLNSEGGATTLVTNINVSTSAAPLTGFTASIDFPASAVAAAAYRDFTFVNGKTYTLSFFVKMADNTAPVISSSSNTGDFSLQANNSLPTPSAVTLIGNSIYRVSRIFTSNGYGSAGIVRYATQSAKAFTVSGYQISEGSTLHPYNKTTTAALGDSFRISQDSFVDLAYTPTEPSASDKLKIETYLASLN